MDDVPRFVTDIITINSYHVIEGHSWVYSKAISTFIFYVDLLFL